MLSDEEINQELKKAINRYAKKEVNKRRVILIYMLGFVSGIVFTLLLQLL